MKFVCKFGGRISLLYIHTLYYSFITIEEVRCGLFQEKEKEKLV